jgi:hypothetical protein
MLYCLDISIPKSGLDISIPKSGLDISIPKSGDHAVHATGMILVRK